MRRALLLALTGVLALLTAVPAAATSNVTEDGDTVVSFTFGGTYKGQEIAARILAEHKMAGTFYINSGYLGYPAYLEPETVATIARMRHEIGGASLNNIDLTKASSARVRREVCNDRATLDMLGFQVTSFAYPYGAVNRPVRSVVQSCGYNSARDISGLRISDTHCSDCPVGETLPPSDNWRIRTNTTDVSLTTLKARVLAAEQGGGGWVPLVFGRVCVCPDRGDEAITPRDFTEFVEWMDARSKTTQVYTVDQVVGGAFRKVEGQPLDRLLPGGTERRPGDHRILSLEPAFSVLGFDVGQTQVVFTGVLVMVAMLGTAVLVRRNRFVRR